MLSTDKHTVNAPVLCYSVISLLTLVLSSLQYYFAVCTVSFNSALLLFCKPQLLTSGQEF